jgi:hypothetical protein
MSSSFMIFAVQIYLYNWQQRSIILGPNEALQGTIMFMLLILDGQDIGADTHKALSFFPNSDLLGRLAHLPFGHFGLKVTGREETFSNLLRVQTGASFVLPGLLKDGE